ncbi:hypothetical protein F4777DRAFT_578615 [Nemania sp. FL0916]|nr:hypothetical protein F4777DRAFT_578615 [Nemania sp. FL0916]
MSSSLLNEYFSLKKFRAHHEMVIGHDRANSLFDWPRYEAIARWVHSLPDEEHGDGVDGEDAVARILCDKMDDEREFINPEGYDLDCAQLRQGAVFERLVTAATPQEARENREGDGNEGRGRGEVCSDSTSFILSCYNYWAPGVDSFGDEPLLGYYYGRAHRAANPESANDGDDEKTVIATALTNAMNSPLLPSSQDENDGGLMSSTLLFESPEHTDASPSGSSDPSSGPGQWSSDASSSGGGNQVPSPIERCPSPNLLVRLLSPWHILAPSPSSSTASSPGSSSLEAEDAGAKTNLNNDKDAGVGASKDSNDAPSTSPQDGNLEIAMPVPPRPLLARRLGWMKSSFWRVKEQNCVHAEGEAPGEGDEVD